jgi:hypothetical protein
MQERQTRITKTRSLEVRALLSRLSFSLALLSSVGGAGLAAAADEGQLQRADAPDSATSAAVQPTALQRLVDFPLLHPRVTLNWRSYGFGSEPDNIPAQHTWASGGRLGITFPEWHEWLSLGLSGYASVPIGDTATPNRSLLVGADDKSLVVAGESYLNARSGNLNLRLYRQLLDAPYLNDQDNRMIPNVFEGYTLLYRTDKLYAGVGYIARMKARDSDEYRWMSEVAGATGDHTGLIAGGARWNPYSWLMTSAFAFYNEDLFSLVYLASEVDSHLNARTDLRLSAQFTSQQSVGEERIGSFDAHSVGVKAQLGYRKAVLTLAATRIADGAAMRSPFGQRPSYLSLMLYEFDRAGEDGWLGGLSYRLDELGLPSWSLVANHAEGRGARNPTTRQRLAMHRENDLTVDYRPTHGSLNGLWLRMRYASGGEGSLNSHQWRVLLNYEVKSAM